MNLTSIDWLIVIISIVILFFAAGATKKLVRSVADFLSAGRTAGRYLITISQGIVIVGAITIVAQWEANYVAGFALQWWQFTMVLVLVIISVTGWVIYRFRQTRALTIAQFFEIRYSRKFRIFAGILAFISGILNYGIFPLVTAKFLIYFCGLPLSFSIAGINVPTFPVVMAVILIIPLYFVFNGGQIAVLFTDFIQGIYANVAYVAIIIFCLFFVDWNQIFQAVITAPKDASLINPYKTGEVPDFNFWFFLINVIGLIYAKLSWQGQQGFNSSAKSAHEAKMSDVLGNLRNIPRALFFVFIPVVAFTIMHSPDFTSIANAVQNILNGIANESVQNQLRTSLVLSESLPVGLMGAFLVLMLYATISTDISYMHSWGSIFIQDVILPFRKKAFEPKQHLKILRYSTVGVCIFIFIFSLIFPLNQYIFLYFAVTAAIFTGGSGAVIIGGLYWKKGTTTAAWLSLIIGSVIAVTGIVVTQSFPDFPINGQYFWGIAMGVSSIVYIVVSLLGKRENFDLDKMLHRGKYEIKEETKVIEQVPQKGWKLFGIGKEFTKGDKIIYISAYSWTFLWVVVFIIGTIINLSTDVPDSSWIRFWETFVYINLAASIIVVIWFTIGGFKDFKEMVHRLKTMERDHLDDGTVRHDKK
ncbi:MAG: sodium:solute symporter [Bacteroidota bacterium]